MGRLTKVSIAGFRSVKDQICIDFPDKMPVVLVGENNAGKSNIVRAIDLVLGEWYAGTREPEDHDFWDRNAATGQIGISDRERVPLRARARGLFTDHVFPNLEEPTKAA
jgi:predicted ATP-dependent endonuclease of OLD family